MTPRSTQWPAHCLNIPATKSSKVGEVDQPKTTNRNLWLVLAIYAAITGVLSLQHTMWRDELQLWLYGYKSSNFAEFIQNRKAEIHPVGYQLFTYIVSRFASNPEILKLTNWIFSNLLALIILFHTKLRNTYKILFLFGLIPLVGYSHIAEQYMPATLFFILLLNLFSNGRNRALFFIVASVIANLHILFLLASIGFVVVYAVESFEVTKKVSQLFRSNNKLICWIAFYFTSVVFGLSLISRTTASSKLNGLSDLPHLIKRSLIVIGSACFPFINFQSNANNHSLSSLLFLLLAALILLGLFYLAIKQGFKLGLAIVLSNSLLIAAMVIGFSSYWWHFGVLYLSLFMSLVVLFQSWPMSQFDRFAHQFLIGLLLLSQVIALFIGPNTNLWERKPYSTAEQAANFLKRNCNNTCTIIMNSQSTGASVSGYMDRRDIYYADIGQFGSFARWDLPTTEVTWEVMVSSAKTFENPILVTSEMTNPPNKVFAIKSFSGAVWQDENFTVSRIIP